MNIELYRYGIEMELDEAIKILRGALGTKLSKRDKDVRIAEAIGIISTVNFLVDVVEEPESEQAEDSTP